MTAPTNIIVRMPNWLGDLVMGTPVLADLRAHYKEGKITAMCLAGQSPLLENNPNVDEIFRFTRPSGWVHRIQHHDVIEPLSRGKYDLGLLLTNSFTSAWWFWRGHVENRTGYAGHWRRLLLNDVVPTPPNAKTEHQVVLYKHLLAPLGIPLSNTSPQLFITNAQMAAARELLRKCGVEEGTPIVGINPGAAYGTAKCWLPDRFKEVTRRLISETHCYVLYFGDHSTAKLVGDICRDLPARVINLAGKTNLSELMALIKCCKVLLTNDSGPMHIAAAVGTPPLALFGSTSDVQTGPYGLGEVIHKHVECSPCFRRVCPIDFRCMKRIEVDEVYHELRRLMGPGHPVKGNNPLNVL